MRIIIIGGGKVGSAIAMQLTDEGHDITVVDQSHAVAERISDELDCMTICGNGADAEVLREAGVDKCELLLACTAQDELNMLCCVFAMKLGCENTIARVRTPQYSQQLYLLKDRLGLTTTINPEMDAARELFRLLEIPGVFRRDSFARGRVEMVEVVPKAGDALDGTQLMQLPRKVGCRVFVGAVQRGEETVIPDGRFTLRAGDKVYLCAPVTEVVHILRRIGDYRRRARDVLLLGGSRVTEYLLAMLLKADARVTLVESDAERARHFAERFPEATVVCADLSSERVLKEENIERTDAAVMLTDSDEENLILSMYAASLHVPQILTLVDHLEFGNLLRDAGNQMISPKQICADIIVRYVRGMQNTSGSSVVALHHLTGGADALEFNITSSCRNLGTRLRDIRLKPNILIACINRRGNIIIPGGMDTLERGDTVIVIAGSNRVILDLNDIFDSGD